MVESKLTESTTKVQNLDSGQTVALAALFVGTVSDGLVAKKQMSRENGVPQARKLSKRSLHLHGVSHFNWSIIFLDASLLSK